jgi:hypothetical protein
MGRLRWLRERAVAGCYGSKDHTAVYRHGAGVVPSCAVDQAFIVGGGAVVPLLYGHLKGVPAIGNSLSFFLCTLPCYLYILYYAPVIKLGDRMGRMRCYYAVPAIGNIEEEKGNPKVW